MKAGTRVRIKDNEMAKAWGMANELGVVTGPDPKNMDSEIVTVKLDSKQAICESGIHIRHLEPA